jgi:hypothetical protein
MVRFARAQVSSYRLCDGAPETFRRRSRIQPRAAG